jgi:hypothetical protein
MVGFPREDAGIQESLTYTSHVLMYSREIPPPTDIFSQEHAVIPARGSDGDRYFTLACTKAQEANMYLDEKGSPIVLDVLDQVSSRIPLHLVLGEVKNFMWVPCTLLGGKY